ncbi:platelet-derived growth factor receptor alpha-like [Cotesia glomerata]|uniref:platelet-derived growth factor receptor alpha-like n=1 Tax=Cotesia glomerata TaxID=32391 RepID=UPI001D019BAE|nr:platelet-derived growth factor receptor alpha-like [Cotesia glomerata]
MDEPRILSITRSEAKLSDERVNGLTKFTLKRSNLVFGDSGWYGCIEKSKYKPDAHLSKFDITPYNYDEANVKWIYVTNFNYTLISATQYWLHDIPFLRKNANGEYVLLKKEDDDVTLPCRSTSADYSVKLYNSIDNTPIDSFEYDPKKGITLKKIKNDSILQYNCLAEKKDGTKSEPKKFKIEIIENFLEKPEITSETLTLMEIGKNFSMECTGLVLNYETYFLDWTIPQTDRIIKDLKTYSVPAAENKELSYYQVTLQLTIKNVVKEDFGNYECRLYKSASVETAKINLTPHDKKHLKLSLKSPKSGEVIESGAQHTWTIDIDAYPLPKLHWFNPQKNEIFKPPKLRSFQVNDEKFSLDFTMTQFTVDDLGTHTIVAKSSDIEKTVTFDVLAQTPAKVMEVKQNEACLTKGATVFQCHAKGYPVPEISWNCVDKAGVVGDETGLKVIEYCSQRIMIRSR